MRKDQRQRLYAVGSGLATTLFLGVSGCQITIHNDGGTVTERHIVSGGNGNVRETITVNGKKTVIEGGQSVVVRNGEVIFRGGSAAEKQTIDKAVPAASVQALTVRSNYGSITFVPPTSHPDQITIHAEVQGGGSHLTAAEWKRYLPGFTISAENQSGTLQVSVVPPSDFPKNVGYGVSFQIAVPPQIALKAHTASGGIEVQKTRTIAKIDLQSDYGSLRVADAGTDISARTASGGVTIEDGDFRSLASVSAHSDYGSVDVTGAARRVDAQTSSGSVTVRKASQAQEIRAHSDYGSITVTDGGGAVEASSNSGQVDYSGNPTRLRCHSDYGSVKVDIAGSAPALKEAELTTSSGSVDLNVSRQASLHITAQTTSGGITNHGLPGEMSGDNYAHTFTGTLNGGRAPIKLSSGYGSIAITAD